MEETPQYVHELASMQAADGNSQDDFHESIAAPPADGGLRAWLLLGACSFLEAMTWGFPAAFGLFQDYYTTNQPFSERSEDIPVIGTTALGTMYFSAPFVAFSIASFPSLRRTCAFVGLAILVASTVTASFASTVNTLILTQGFGYGVGGGILYFPVITFLDEWFIRRRGFAYGVAWAGSGVAGIILPYLLRVLLSRYGFRATLRVWALAMVVLTIPALFILKPRVPQQTRPSHFASQQRIHNETEATNELESTANTTTQAQRQRTSQRITSVLSLLHRRHQTDLSFLLTPTFLIIQVANVLVNLGSSLPAVFLPTYAREQSLHPTQQTGSTSLAILNLMGVLGFVLTGVLTDRHPVLLVMLLSTLIGATAIFFLWGLAASSAQLYAFAATYGLAAGGLSVTWSACAGLVRTRMEQRGGQGATANVHTSMVVASLAAGKGLGAVVSGPLSARLLSAAAGAAKSGVSLGVYGTRFEALVMFAGVSACCGCFGWIGQCLGVV